MRLETEIFFAASTGGFYTRDIHGDAIPEDAVTITAEQHSDLIAATSSGAQIDVDSDGAPQAKWPAPPTSADMLIAARAAAVASVLKWIDDFLSTFTAGVPATEVASWGIKGVTANAHLAGQPQAMIIAEASVTGEDPDALAAKIAAKADLYTAIIARTTGLRRVTLDAIAAAKTIKAVEGAVKQSLTTATAMVAAMGLPLPPQN